MTYDEKLEEIKTWMDSNSITNMHLMRWLSLSKSAVSLKLSGNRKFTFNELSILDYYMKGGYNNGVNNTKQ